ncbi:hypothetical protein ZWY2020_028987 [Hordeum vulgare]|nr:hypothetical protein ZWY2020_028987 [Hordeum vulgare]
MEVMVIGGGTSKPHGKASSEVADPAAGSGDTLHAALAGLKTPIATSANPADARASLEEARRQILEEGIIIAAAKRRMEATQREYNSAYGLTPAVDGPSRLSEVRGHGRVITNILGGKHPIYDTPVANLRAAQAAMAEMPSLESEERVLQEKRVKYLLDAGNEQQSLLDPGHAQPVSLGADLGAHRNPNGRHHAEGSSSHRTSGRKGEGSQDRHSLRQSKPASGRHRRDAGYEGDSVREVPPPRRWEGANATSSQDTLPISARIGPRVLTTTTMLADASTF